MTTAILVAGIGLILVLGALSVRPAWRLPALIFAVLVIPGNVDDLLPQMMLDPHNLRDVSAPVFSSVDLLLGWALLLTLREGRRPDTWGTRLMILALVVMGLAWITALVAAASGVETAAAIRGVIVFARLPAAIFLASALRDEIVDATPLALAVVAGGVGLLGNGLYTTIGDDLDRFTARTFGRNGFAIVLVFVVVVATAYVYRRWHLAGRPGLDRLIMPAAILVGAACLFGASASGTRMGSIVLILVAAVAFVASPSGWSRSAVRGTAVTAAAAFVILGASVVLTTAGGRTMSVITDPDTTVGVVTSPGDLPTETEIRSRGQFWELAMRMARSKPLTGVGPYQWNVVRYELDPKGPVVVADAHNSYLQVLAEYGVVVFGAYLVLLASAVAFVVWQLRRAETRRRLGWAGLGFAIAALVFPIADTTNSHLFNVRNGLIEWLAIGIAIALASRVGGATARGADGPPA